MRMRKEQITLGVLSNDNQVHIRAVTFENHCKTNIAFHEETLI